MAGTEDVNANRPVVAQPPRLKGKEALRVHLTLLAGLTLCSVAFWFEIGRAERGNSLSWAYVFEWPLLGMFAVYMWWKILHPGREAMKVQRSTKPAIAPEFEGMLAAWQDYQRDLNDQTEASPLSPPREDRGNPS